MPFPDLYKNAEQGAHAYVHMTNNQCGNIVEIKEYKTITITFLGRLLFKLVNSFTTCSQCYVIEIK